MPCRTNGEWVEIIFWVLISPSVLVSSPDGVGMKVRLRFFQGQQCLSLGVERRFQKHLDEGVEEENNGKALDTLAVPG